MHGKPCTRALLGKGEAPKDRDPEPKCHQDGIREAREEKVVFAQPLWAVSYSPESHYHH